MQCQPLLKEQFKLDVIEDDDDDITPTFNRNFIIFYLSMCIMFDILAYWLYIFMIGTTYDFDIVMEMNLTNWILLALLTYVWILQITIQFTSNIRDLKLIWKEDYQKLPKKRMAYFNDFKRLTYENLKITFIAGVLLGVMLLSFTILILAVVRYPLICNNEELCRLRHAESFLMFSASLTALVFQLNKEDDY